MGEQGGWCGYSTCPLQFFLVELASFISSLMPACKELESVFLSLLRRVHAYKKETVVLFAIHLHNM